MQVSGEAWDAMDPVVIVKWTGRLANALKLALRMSSEAFAERLGASPRAVAEWGREPEMVPTTVMQQALDTLLSQSDDDAKTRFEFLVYGRSSRPGTSHVSDAGDLAMANFLDWVDLHAGWQPGTAQLQLDDQLARMTPHLARQKAARRAQVAHSTIAGAISALYGSQLGEHYLYEIRCGRTAVTTSILTTAEWTESIVRLGYGRDSLTASPDRSAPVLALDDTTAAAAIHRISESINLQTRTFNAALYSLTHIDISHQEISGQVRLIEFADYALTLDLLEGELIDAIISGHGEVEWLRLPLRQRYLGSVEHALNLGDRLCAGGPLALLAIARPRSRGHGADYAIVVQERSPQVLNATGRLAVIPKGFHQPLADFSDDMQLSVTLERELEEELLGREELELAGGTAQRLDPLHRTRLSEPMRWLIDRAGSDAWRTECTGFGLNLVSGNYEFASLITIEDEEWWTLFGGKLIANWEVGGIRIYSSLDVGGVSSLVNDERWSDEGLFAFLQGIRRLAQIGQRRVNLPPIGLEYDE
jgi:hypothetical protein